MVGTKKGNFLGASVEVDDFRHFFNYLKPVDIPQM